LTFTELEALARPLLPVLLALLDARVARQEAFLLQLRPQLEVVLHERARDPEAQRAGLARDAAAGDRRQDVELVAGLGDGQRPLDLGAKRFGGEGLLDRLVIDGQNARARPQEHARRRRFATAGPVILDCCCHRYATSLLEPTFSAFGFCDSCGCLSP